MEQSKISEQAEKYAEVIVGQIAGNFQELHKSIESCTKLKKTLDEYKKAHNQSEWSKFIFEKNIDEYIGYVDKSKKETGCNDYNKIEPLAVGLFGEWGSGKTHQLKLIKQNILYPPKDVQFPQTTIPVFFNAWRFEKEEHIIIPLFQTLLQAVEDYEYTLGKKLGKGYRTLSMYLKFGLLSLHKGLKVPSDLASFKESLTNLEFKKAIDEIIDTSKISQSIKEKIKKIFVGKQTLIELIKPDQLESIYLNIPQWIEKITLFENVNFVFLIDDLDRCLPENTLKMLESIKLFLDVPSCAFVLAVDDDVVERGVVHHYRDYLSIYHSKEEGAKDVLQHELPITGHEYLEKMIQLPIRLPVIDTVNVRAFLEEHSSGWIGIVDKAHNEKAEEERKKLTAPSERLLDFFAKTIPPKPRKIKRTALLFESKLKLLEGLSHDEMLVAKITLLELFAPKLLRYIQNNGYTIIYNRLCHFREVEYLAEQEGLSEEEKEENENTKVDEILLNDLSEVKSIEKYIKRGKEKDPSAYTQKEQNVLLKLMDIVEEHYSSRITFDLDHIFTEKIDASQLKKVIEMQEEQHKTTVSMQKSIASFDNDTLQRLFRSGDTDAWREALAEHDAMINSSGLAVLIKKAQEEKDATFNDLPFIANPEWVGVVAEYLNEDEYKSILKASHDVRFKNIKDKFEIDMFQLTFAEYDKYCDIVGDVEKPKDEGWGRGRRPVINVSWSDAIKYIEWLNTFMESKYALPAKAEWDLACYNEKDTKWHFGDNEKLLKEYAWYYENSDSKTHPVGEKKPNDFGLYDMYGNVWEWCKDDANINFKVIKGGGKGAIADMTSNDSVGSREKSEKRDNIGFRLLRTLRS